MRELIYNFITWVARVHDSILSINDTGGYYFDDKQLHFLVIGAFGMALIFVIYPIFKWLANHGHTMVVTWIYVFTVILVLSFAIEIGQWYSGTGTMDSEDIAYGLSGFLVMFLIFAIVRGIYHGIRSLLKKDTEDEDFRHSYKGY
ncbi:MAG: hypothetical protein E7219_05000 [Clostridiales bacterium]|nr:hypothetical protein [Clostridiales bacterium]